MNFLKKYRKSKGLTQSELASKARTNQAKIQRIESGQDVSADMAALISAALEIPVAEIFPGSIQPIVRAQSTVQTNGTPVNGASTKNADHDPGEFLDEDEPPSATLHLEVSTVFERTGCEGSGEWMSDEYNAKVMLLMEEEGKQEGGTLEMTKLCFEQAMQEGFPWLTLVDRNQFTMDLGGSATDSFKWSKKTIKAVGENNSFNPDVLLVGDVEIKKEYAELDLDLWAIWVAATKLSVGLVVFDPTYSNMFEEVQDTNERMKKLLEHYGRIGFRPFQQKIWNGETVTFLVLNVEEMPSEEEAGLPENGIIWFPEQKQTADPQHN